MSNQEDDALKEIIVCLYKSPYGKSPRLAFTVPRAIVNYYQIENDDGLRCVLKEKSNNAKMEKTEKIDKEILIDVTSPSGSTEWDIPWATSHVYDLKIGNYLRLLINEVIHNKR